MTTIAETGVPRVPSGRYGLAQAARMEWIKLRTLAAIPRRPLVLAAKAAVFGGVTLVVGEAASFIAFLAAAATLRHGLPVPTLGQPGVLRAVVLSGATFCLIGLLGLGLGAIIRHSAVAVGVPSCPQFLSSWAGLGVLCLYAAIALAAGGWPR